MPPMTRVLIRPDLGWDPAALRAVGTQNAEASPVAQDGLRDAIALDVDKDIREDRRGSTEPAQGRPRLCGEQNAVLGDLHDALGPLGHRPDSTSNTSGVFLKLDRPLSLNRPLLIQMKDRDRHGLGALPRSSWETAMKPACPSASTSPLRSSTTSGGRSMGTASRGKGLSDESPKWVPGSRHLGMTPTQSHTFQ